MLFQQTNQCIHYFFSLSFFCWIRTTPGLCDGTIPVNDLLIWPASYKPTSPCSLFFYFELGWWSLQVCRSFTREFSVPLLGISSFHQSFFSFLNFATLVVFSTCSSVSRKVNAAFDCDLNQREMAEL